MAGKMTLVTLFHIYAVVITIKNGLFSALKLGWIKNKSGMETANPRATTEMRAVWGGLLLGLGIAGLVFPIPEVYKTIGIVYVVRNVIRGVSMLVEKSIDRASLYRKSLTRLSWLSSCSCESLIGQQSCV